MIIFLFKGLIRDKHRSLFPFIVVTMGVLLTVLMSCWVQGVMGDMVDMNARFSTGHVSITTRGYAENKHQIPNDLALLEITSLLNKIEASFPDTTWVQRIHFGGLIDIPDESGETRDQGPAIGLAVDLFNRDSGELERLFIEKSLKKGRLPNKSGEVLFSDDFATKLGIAPGQSITLITSSMHGSMCMQNFILAGTVTFGMQVMDRGSFIIDLSDARSVLDMQDASGEVLGYFNRYDENRAQEMAHTFNTEFNDPGDEFSPFMQSLSDQEGVGDLLKYAKAMIGIAIAVFVFAMSIVLWNTGLIGALRRYGEIGVRLALGETKGAVYRSMVAESFLVGLFGSCIGTGLGLLVSWYLEVYGIEVGSTMKNATMMFPNVFRANITVQALYIGFFPGLLSTVLGTCLAGIGILRRQTAQLFKELEA